MRSLQPSSRTRAGPLLQSLPLLFQRIFVIAGISGLMISCVTGRQVVFVPESDGLVKIGDDMRGHVYWWNKGTSSWELSKGKVSLPAGWLAGSLPDPEKEE